MNFLSVRVGLCETGREKEDLSWERVDMVQGYYQVDLVVLVLLVGLNFMGLSIWFSVCLVRKKKLLY